MLVFGQMPDFGVPGLVRVQVGERRCVVIANANQARGLADVLVGLTPPPPDGYLPGNVDQVVSTPTVRLVPPEGGLLPHLTVGQNILHGYRTTNWRRRRTSIDSCWGIVSGCGLNDILRRYPHEITPRRRRLVGVARALSARPTAIVLEDAAGLPVWGKLLDFDNNTELKSVAWLLITLDEERAIGFSGADNAK